MAVSSDTCRSLNSPYVSLRLKFIEPSGHICQRSFEMTIPQFQVCICSCECSVVGVINYCFDLLSFFFLSAELSQTVQGDGSCDGDCMMVAFVSVTSQFGRILSHIFFFVCWLSKMWIQMTPELWALHFHFSTNCINSQMIYFGDRERGVSLTKPTLIDINGVDKIIETPVSITQYNLPAPKTTSCKMSMTLRNRKLINCLLDCII